MSTKASEVTGVTMVGDTMFVHGKEVQAVPVRNALEQFIAFLKQCQQNSPVLLVGHNIKNFDSKILIHALTNCDLLSDFENATFGFLDTLNLFKKTLPKQPSYRQEDLLKNLLGETYSAHSAIHDVIALQKLMATLVVERTVLNLSSFSCQHAIKSYVISSEVRKNLPSLHTMVDKKIISPGIARTIAGSGLNCNHLQISWKRNGIDGLRNLLSEVNDGHIRVTRSEKIIAAIGDYICNLN